MAHGRHLNYCRGIERRPEQFKEDEASEKAGG